MPPTKESKVALHDHAAPRTHMRDEVMEGLRATRKHISPKYLYDETGSELFDRICALDEYYPTRTELGIMSQYIGDMVKALGQNCRLIEFGSGSSMKTRMLLDHIEEANSYVPLDISRDYLFKIAGRLAAQYPNIKIEPVCADFTRTLDLPRPERQPRRRVVYFPGSTIGNFTLHEAVAILKEAARIVGPGGGLLLGGDLRKDPSVITPAYNDAEGVTARFNLNVLARFNRELNANFEVDQFWHHAFYTPREGRVEMHLVSRRDQRVRLGGEEFFFQEGESIHTECSHKFTRKHLEKLAAEAGFKLVHHWTDEQSYFSVNYFTVPSTS